MENKNRVIFVLLDGLNYKNSEYMGYMTALEREGKAKFSKVLAEMPSLSKPLYETILTGKKPVEHGVLTNEIPVMSKEKNIFSVFAINGVAHNVTIKNALYNIESYKLEENRPLGVSNQFVNANPVISVGKGSLLIVY